MGDAESVLSTRTNHENHPMEVKVNEMFDDVQKNEEYKENKEENEKEMKAENDFGSFSFGDVCANNGDDKQKQIVRDVDYNQDVYDDDDTKGSVHANSTNENLFKRELLSLFCNLEEIIIHVANSSIIQDTEINQIRKYWPSPQFGTTFSSNTLGTAQKHYSFDIEKLLDIISSSSTPSLKRIIITDPMFKWLYSALANVGISYHKRFDLKVRYQPYSLVIKLIKPSA